MLALHAAWSDSLCSGPSATSRKAGVDSPSGTEKLSGTKGSGQPRSPTASSVRAGCTRGSRGAGSDELLDRGDGAVAQARHGGGAARRQCAAEVVDGDLVAAGTPRGVDQAPERVQGGAAAGQHHGARLQRVQRPAEAGGIEPHREGQRAQAATAQAQLERLGVQRVHVARGAGVEDEHAVLARGRRRDARRRGQPARRPAPREAVLGVGALAVGVEDLDAGEEHLLDGALDGAHGQALLEHAVGVDLVEAREGAAQARRRRRAGAALARQGDGGGDVVRLLEGGAQRLDLVEVELPVAAGGAARLGVAEAPLP